ncbi:MAG: type II secretion system F family protein [Lachnospiraceae bacterium]|nr:type II secretion system F family protein [Lachnospiraceae bacterium]
MVRKRAGRKYKCVKNNRFDLYRKKIDRYEFLQDMVGGLVILLCISYFFYHSLVPMVFLSPILLVYRRLCEIERARLRKQKLSLQFKDGILAVSAALKAGYSIENAFFEAYKDLCHLYKQDDTIVKEFLHINRQLKNNVVLETLLMDFAIRSQVEEIKDFAEVFSIAKRSGGNLNKIIENTALIISEKIQVKRDIQTILASKQFEQKVMNMVPLFILFYIEVTSPGFFSPMYKNPAGICIMTICLAVYFAAYLLSRKIVAIEV